MFRDDVQRARVCNALTYSIRGEPLWQTMRGYTKPLPLAISLLRTPISTHEATMVHLAWIVWNGGYGRAKTSKLSRLLDGLDGTNLQMLGGLLTALGTSMGYREGGAIDNWLQTWERAGVAERQRMA